MATASVLFTTVLAKYRAFFDNEAISCYTEAIFLGS